MKSLKSSKMEEVPIIVQKYKNRENNGRNYICNSCIFLLLLIIIYLLIAVFTLNQKIIENENIFFVEKDKLIMHTLEQQKISKINKEKKNIPIKNHRY